MNTGTYRLITAAGSLYFVDFDRMILCRAPGSHDPQATFLLKDGTDVGIVWIGKLEVGATVPMILDLGLPGLHDTFRRTTPVVSVEQVDGNCESVASAL